MCSLSQVHCCIILYNTWYEFVENRSADIISSLIFGVNKLDGTTRISRRNFQETRERGTPGSPQEFSKRFVNGGHTSKGV